MWGTLMMKCWHPSQEVKQKKPALAHKCLCKPCGRAAVGIWVLTGTFGPRGPEPCAFPSWWQGGAEPHTPCQHWGRSDPPHAHPNGARGPSFFYISWQHYYNGFLNTLQNICERSKELLIESILNLSSIVYGSLLWICNETITLLGKSIMPSSLLHHFSVY